MISSMILRLPYHRSEFVIIEVLFGEWVDNKPVYKQSAQINAKRNLATRVGRYGLETEVCIAVGHRLSTDSIPEKNAGSADFKGIGSRFVGLVDGRPYGIFHRSCR